MRRVTGKIIVWVAGVAVALYIVAIVIPWAWNWGIFLGEEQVPQTGLLNGQEVEHSILQCRYLTLTGTQTRRGGWPPGTDPDMTLPDGMVVRVAEYGCPKVSLWDYWYLANPGRAGDPANAALYR